MRPHLGGSRRGNAVALALLFTAITVAPAALAQPLDAGEPRAAPTAVPELPELEPTPPPAVLEEEGPGVGSMLFRTAVVLAMVVGLVYLTLNVGLRKLMGLQRHGPARVPVVRVHERVPLDQRRAVFLIEAAGEYLLVGAGEGSFALLAKLDPSEVQQRQQAGAAVEPSPLLKKLSGWRGTPPSSA